MEQIANDDYSSQLRSLRLLLGQKFRPITTEALAKMTRLPAVSVRGVEAGRRVLNEEDRKNIALYVGASWNSETGQWVCSENEQVLFSIEEHVRYLSRFGFSRAVTDRALERISDSLGRLLHALDAQEADRTLLRVRELLLEIAQENQLSPDIIGHLKAAISFGDRPVEGFKLSEVQEDYKTPEERLGRLRAQRKAASAEPREKRIRKK